MRRRLSHSLSLHTKHLTAAPPICPQPPVHDIQPFLARSAMPRQNKSRAAGLSTLAVAALALPVLFAAGCNHSSTDPPGAVTFLVETMPANLDPRLGTDARSQQLDGLIFSSLLEHDATMSLRGDL